MKSYNWKKGIMFFIACTVGGGIAGLIIGLIGVNTQIGELINMLNAIAPSLFVISFISGSIGLGGYFYFNAKLKKDYYCDEEGSFYDKYEKTMGIVMMCSTLGAIINFTALGVNAFNLTSLDNLFIVNVIISFLGEVAHISLIKKVRPELNADPLDTKFNKNYFKQLDEYEKNKVGKASFDTVTAMVPLYVFLLVGCYALIRGLEVSPVICLPVGIIWIVQTVLLTYYSIRETKA